MTAEIIRPRVFHRGPAVRCIDPVDELYALAAIAETRAEKAGQKLERDCDRALEEIEELLANVLKLKELMGACSMTNSARITDPIRNQPEPV